MFSLISSVVMWLSAIHLSQPRDMIPYDTLVQGYDLFKACLLGRVYMDWYRVIIHLRPFSLGVCVYTRSSLQ